MDVEAARQIYSAGEHLEQVGKLEQAVACFQQAIELYPEYYHYHYKLGQILRQRNKLEQAAACFHQAIALNPQDSWSYHALGEVATKRDKIPPAIAYYHQAIALNPNFSWSHYNLARLYKSQNDLETAKTHLETAIDLEPDFFWSHYFLAEILTEMKATSAAISHYQQVIRLNPKFYRAYYQLARHLQQVGRLETAVEYYRQGIKLDGSDFNCYYFLAETLIQLNRASEAICYSEAAIELQPNNLLPYYILGLILLGRGERAIAEYRESAANNSTVVRVNLELGIAQAWQQQGKLSKSVECCQQAIELDPTAEMPYRILQYISVDSAEIEQAIAFYRQISRSAEVSPLLWGNLGDLLTKQDRISEAIDCYRKSCYYNAIQSNPSLAEFGWQQDQAKAPSFIIIGASKSGTTSLFFNLSKHPQILVPHKKEINFFNHNFASGKSWYLAQFPAIADGKQFITGEASPLYIYNQQARTRIKQLFPHTKIIVMVRNPVDRTISEYYHAVNHAIETRTLTEIIEQETELLTTKSRSEVLHDFGYLLNSIYVDNIAKWQTDFSPENTLIIESEAFFARTDETMQQVWQFLGLPAIALPECICYNVGSYPSISPEIKQQLQDFFVPYNRELAAHLNRSFSW